MRKLLLACLLQIRRGNAHGLIDVVGVDENGVAAVGDLDRTANEDSNGTEAGVFEE